MHLGCAPSHYVARVVRKRHTKRMTALETWEEGWVHTT